MITAPTVHEHLLARADDDRPGLLAGDSAWRWREVVRESGVHGAAMSSLLPAGHPPHVGVLLENTPEFLFLL
ncbi:MAG: acyl-CoA synthetase, partial [Pimelobacter sp.]|nr:acyl-CoA synthetase [Pimelobacter sp.]